MPLSNKCRSPINASPNHLLEKNKRRGVYWNKYGIIGQTPKQLKAQIENSHLSMLVLATGMKLLLLCNLTTVCYIAHIFFSKTEVCSMNTSGLKPQQLHPRTVHTSDGICWAVSCFAHDLTWQACELVQLVMTLTVGLGGIDTVRCTCLVHFSLRHGSPGNVKRL